MELVEAENTNPTIVGCACATNSAFKGDEQYPSLRCLFNIKLGR